MPPITGMRFGRYELAAPLGAGGMGEVWRAHDQELHRDVAVKFLPERFATDSLRLGRFAQEARAASSLNHPNIVTIHDFGETAGLPYIVMELVEGRTLREHVAEGRPLPVRRILDIGAQMADGLAKAHAAGIVHRDLKPENVMVTDDGFVKLLDFGLAKLRADGSGERPQWFDSAAPTWPDSPSPKTAAGVVLGTVGYMSPEQARGRPVDYRGDQFALGAILYELATGRPAFRRETGAQTLAAIIEDAPEPIAGLNPHVPAPVRWLVEGRCLAKEPSERYASTLDLARDLRQFREHLVEAGGSMPARTDEMTGPKRRFRLRRSWIAPAVAAILGAALWAGSPLVDRARRAVGLDPLPAEKRIAVLAFEAPSGREEDRATAIGLVHQLTARLAQLEPYETTVSVEPASNVLQSGVRSAHEAARSLGATLVVTGSVQRDGDRVSFTASLEDARRNRTLGAASGGDPDALGNEVVRLLRLELGQEARSAQRAASAAVAEAATLAAQAFGYAPYAEGRTALERYDSSQSLERAIDLFNRALERDPRYAAAHAALGEAYLRLYTNEKRPGLVSLAEQHARRALELDALLAGPWLTLGMVAAGSGHAEEALADFQKALDRDPRSAAVFKERGAALERLRRWDEAEASYRKAVLLRPDSWAAHNYLGTFLLERNRAVEAEAAFRRALELAPDNGRAVANLGAALYYQDRLGDAEASWTRALDLAPTPAVASNLGALQFSEKRYADAARTLEKAASSGTRDYRVWRNLAAARYWAPGERPKAAEAYRRAAELGEQERALDPTNARVLAQLADCYAMLGDAARSAPLAAEAARLAPDDRRVASALAGIHEHLGERDAALRWLGVALEHGYPRNDVESDPTFEKLRRDPRWPRVARAADKG